MRVSQSVAFNLVVECLARNAELLCHLREVAATLRYGVGDGLSLHLFERLALVQRALRGVEFEVIGRDNIAITHNYSLLNRILQLADIAFPRVIFEFLRSIARKHQAGLAILLPKSLDKSLSKGHDILLTVTQGRNMYMYGVDAEEQILSELALGNSFVQVAVGGRD